jgi:tetratricopeptide (TPR) repeat protein
MIAQRTWKTLTKAIQASQKAIDLTPHDDPDLPSWLGNFGTILETRFTHTQKVEDLERSIQITRQAIAAMNDSTAGYAAQLKLLGKRLAHRSVLGQTDTTQDLEEAVQLTRKAVEVTHTNDPDYTNRLGSLSNRLEDLYERTGEMEILEEAIRVSQEELQLKVKKSSDIGPPLHNLGNLLSRRYKRTNETADLEEAIRLVKRSLEVTKKDDPMVSAFLSNLGNKLENRYACTGKIEDLQEAIRVTRQAVDTAPGNSPVLRASLNNLGTQLSRRYEYTSKMEDLEEAIQIERRAVDITPQGHPALATCLINLGITLGERYHRTGRADDIVEAIHVTKQAIQSTPSDHPKLADHVENLASRSYQRYLIEKRIEDLEEAIRLYRRAVNDGPKNHPDTARWLYDLGISLFARYENLKEKADLEEAIGLTQMAINATPQGHPNLASILRTLSEQLLALDPSKTVEALKLLLEAWNLTSAPPFIRILIASQAIRLHQDQEEYDSAYKLSIEAMDLLPRVLNRSLSLEDQQRVVALFSGLATTAFSLSLQVGEPPDVAVQLLERGRGVILSMLIDGRSDTSKLKAAYPRLCTVYEKLRVEVNMPVDSISDEVQRANAIKRRSKAIVQLDNCIKGIRRIPGFSNFQKGLNSDEMRLCAAKGCIVIVNVTDLRSDAIIISASAIRCLSLLDLDAPRAKEWIGQNLTSITSVDRGPKNKAYTKFLSWLWKGCVKKVLDQLGYRVQHAAEDLPRIWWIGTGLASSFPFHAAGMESLGRNESAYYRVISSYSPSIRALAYARERDLVTHELQDHPLKAVIVSMLKTPGNTTLPGAKREQAAVMASIGTSASIQTLDHPDVASVVRELEHCNVAHFACHGASNPFIPSQSGLLLLKPGSVTTEPEVDVLSVHRVSQARLAHAEIAYLSACSTAENAAVELVDEVLHIVSGFQVAGFRHVVGCMWPSNDSICVQVASSFYSKLSRRQTLSYDDRAVALALHKSVLEVKESQEYCKRPLYWVQYVHFGA